MNQKKSTKILLILIIIFFILILIAGVAFAYFATDMFKNDKELFFKYITQIGDPEKGFYDKNLSQYIEKRNNVPFNNKGSLSVNISGDNTDDYKALNDFNISFSGQVDTKNKNKTQNINLNYSSDVKFPLNYKQKDNEIGIQLPLVANKYLAVDSNKNTESLSAYQQYTKLIKKADNLFNIEISDDQLKNIFDKYKEVIFNELNNEWFSKIQESNLTGYKVSLKTNDLKNITIKLLETLKNDQETLNTINEILKAENNSNKITINDIDSQIKNIQNNSTGNDDIILEIIVYKNNNKVSKIQIKSDKILITLEKNNYDYNFIYNYEDNKIMQFFMKFEGLQSLQNIKENIELKLFLDENFEYAYKLDNEINFTDSFTVEDFNNENSWILTNYDNNSVKNFLTQVGERIESINKEQMTKLGLKEDENPIIYLNPFSLTLSMNMKLSIEKSQESNEKERKQIEEQEELLRYYEKQFSSNYANESDAENIEKFNNKFEVYQGTNLSAQTVKGLLTTIGLNNEDDENNKIKEINFEGQEYEASEQNITFVKSDIDMSKNYRVEFEKDQDTGIIYRVIINAR